MRLPQLRHAATGRGEFADEAKKMARDSGVEILPIRGANIDA